MKAHLTKVSLALLSTVFLLGCQEQGSAPVGPDGPQFDKPGTLNKTECDEVGGVFDEKKHCHAGEEPAPVDGAFYVSPGGKGEGYTCAGGAKKTGGRIFGQVTWKNIRRQDNHIHGDITLSGLSDAINGAPGFVAGGTYQIVGNQDALCGGDPSIVDFHLRHGHHTFRKIDATGAREATIGLTFGSEDQLSEGHEPGTHQLWLTIRGPGVLWNPKDDPPPHRVGDVYHDDFGNLLDALNGKPLVPAMVLRSTAVVVVIKKHSGHD